MRPRSGIPAGLGVVLDMQPLEPSAQPCERPLSPSVQVTEESLSLLIASLRRRLAQACVQLDGLRRCSEENAVRVEFLQHALEVERARCRRLGRKLGVLPIAHDLPTQGSEVPPEEAA